MTQRTNHTLALRALTPPLYKETYKQALERVKGLEPCFENAYGIYDSEDGTELNVIYHKQYNKRRK